MLPTNGLYMVDVAIIGAGQTKYGNHQLGMKGMWAEAAKNASRRAPRAPLDDVGAIFLPHRYPSSIQAVSNTPNFAHLGPWERTIIKEIDLKQLKHRIRHASGRWPGEFVKSFQYFLKKDN